MNYLSIGQKTVTGQMLQFFQVNHLGGCVFPRTTDGAQIRTPRGTLPSSEVRWRLSATGHSLLLCPLLLTRYCTHFKGHDASDPLMFEAPTTTFHRSGSRARAHLPLHDCASVHFMFNIPIASPHDSPRPPHSPRRRGGPPRHEPPAPVRL